MCKGLYSMEKKFSTRLLIALCLTFSLSCAKVTKKRKQVEKSNSAKIIKAAVVTGALTGPFVACAAYPSEALSPLLPLVGITGIELGAGVGLAHGVVAAMMASPSPDNMNIEIPAEEIIKPLIAIQVINAALTIPVIMIDHHYTSSWAAGKGVESPLPEIQMVLSLTRIVLLSSLIYYVLGKRIIIALENRKKEKELITKKLTAKPVSA